jgi:hypothetical protein
MVSIKSLNLNSFKYQVSTVDNFLTVSKPSLLSLDTIKSQFLIWSQELIDGVKIQVSTVETLKPNLIYN